jgi:hypothetical protein
MSVFLNISFKCNSYNNNRDGDYNKNNINNNDKNYNDSNNYSKVRAVIIEIKNKGLIFYLFLFIFYHFFEQAQFSFYTFIATKSNGISISMPYWDERAAAMAQNYPEATKNPHPRPS